MHIYGNWPETNSGTFWKLEEPKQNEKDLSNRNKILNKLEEPKYDFSLKKILKDNLIKL